MVFLKDITYQNKNKNNSEIQNNLKKCKSDRSLIKITRVSPFIRRSQKINDTFDAHHLRSKRNRSEKNRSREKKI